VAATSTAKPLIAQLVAVGQAEEITWNRVAEELGVNPVVLWLWRARGTKPQRRYREKIRAWLRARGREATS
jgi:hypothetical protein